MYINININKTMYKNRIKSRNKSIIKTRNKYI